MIAAFCDASGYVMPRNFDISHQTYRFIAVDMSASPPTLVSSSGFMESRVIDHITSPDNAGRVFRVFDFKRFIELHYPGTGRKLLKGAAFDWRTGAPPAAA